MSISAQEAAEIAQRAGLTLSDAAALQNLAGSVEEAKTLAGVFAEGQEPGPRELADQITGGQE